MPVQFCLTPTVALFARTVSGIGESGATTVSEPESIQIAELQCYLTPVADA